MFGKHSSNNVKTDVLVSSHLTIYCCFLKSSLISLSEAVVSLPEPGTDFTEFLRANVC